MRVTITTLSDEIFTLEVSDDMEIENFKAFCEMECGIPARQMALYFAGRPLTNDKHTLKEYSIKDGDVILVQRIQQSERGRGQQQQRDNSGSATGKPTLGIDFGAIQVPGRGRADDQQDAATGAAGRSQSAEDPATLREMLLNSPHDLALLKERNPPLAEALLSGSLEKFTEVLRTQQQERSEKERQRIRLLSANPFDADAQRLIAEEIRLKNVESNMETAMEYAPESFGQVHMLYIDCQVNGHPVKAFVDSGAQMTIMSQACADRCNIMRLVDTRWAGVAKGVGTQKIIGRVHLCQIQIGPDFLQSSFSLLEDQPMDMLLGLDMLKRHQCCLDLKANRLIIGTTGTETPFLSESELPEHARLNHNTEHGGLDEDRQLAEALAKSADETMDTAAGGAGAGAGAGSATKSKPSTQQQQQQHNLPEADVQHLVSQGFSRQQVIEELQRSGGNVQQALAALIAKSLHVP